MNQITLELNMEFDKLMNFTEYMTESIEIEDSYYVEGASQSSVSKKVDAFLEKIKALKEKIIQWFKSIFSKKRIDKITDKLSKDKSKKIKVFDKVKLDKEYDNVNKALKKAKNKEQSEKIMNKFKENRKKILAGTGIVVTCAVAIAVVKKIQLKKYNEKVDELEKQANFYKMRYTKMKEKSEPIFKEMHENEMERFNIMNTIDTIRIMEMDDSYYVDLLDKVPEGLLGNTPNHEEMRDVKRKLHKASDELTTKIIHNTSDYKKYDVKAKKAWDEYSNTHKTRNAIIENREKRKGK